jgi:16S rRNA (adenine1518-N6/adenine1519-N6)-dimethyltransferase
LKEKNSENKELFIKPKKSLGQHFLIDLNIAQKIVNSLSYNTDTIIEIGPGKGILTQFLVKKNFEKLYLIEIDKECIEILSDKYDQNNVVIINNDILDFSFDIFKNNKFSIIGNFPYNISSQIFFKILRHYDNIDEVVCMIQKEVAERICSGPNSKKYGILSVLLQAYFDIKLLFNVNPTVFFPQPKVKSAVIKLRRNNVTKLPCDENLFEKIVKQAFNQRRKILRNSLNNYIDDSTIQHDLFQLRPEQLSYEQFILLTKIFSNNIL